MFSSGLSPHWATKAAWLSGQGAGLEIWRSWVHVPLWPLAGFVPGSPWLNSFAALVYSQLACFLPVGILNLLRFFQKCSACELVWELSALPPCWIKNLFLFGWWFARKNAWFNNTTDEINAMELSLKMDANDLVLLAVTPKLPLLDLVTGITDSFQSKKSMQLCLVHFDRVCPTAESTETCL